jgi:CheY-like chemotaxis protein
MQGGGSGPAARVLVIDDEPLNRKLIRSFLAPERIEVLEAGDAESGLSLARSEHPDLILLDLRLPGMGGLEALEALRRDGSTRETPVVILSAGSLQEEGESFRRAGATGLLLKPFSRADLTRALQAHLPQG